MKKNMSGVSLVEVGAVVGIVSLLAAVMIPIAMDTKSRAVIRICQSNLKQLHVGFVLYSEENPDMFPHGDRDSDTGENHCWFDELDTYLQVENLNTIKQCPSWEGYNPKGITIDRHSIKMNGALCPNERLPETSQQAALQLWYFPRLSQMPQKSRTVLLLDGTMEKPYDTHTDTQIESPHKDVANRHKQGANLLFIDGSSIFVDAKKKKIALGPVGWKHEAGYIWHPYLKPKLFDHE